MPDSSQSSDSLHDEPTIGLVDGLERSSDKKLVEGDGHPAVAGHYEILEQLGSGGMSTVYKVRHLHLHKIFALKLLEQTDPESTQRFHQEARASSSLNHPNIVRVHDFGITADGRAYMVMDYLQGHSLADVLQSEQRLETRRAIRLFSQICSALAHAHENGVVHRDVKPSNIMILASGSDNEQAIVLDFGIAKVATQNQQQFLALTQTGQLFGTPLYMSPEQCQGQKVDARADIYSLGCVMYEVLTGKPPHQGQNTYHTIHKQITEAPPAFPKELRQSRQGRMLESAILRALAKLPQHRYNFVLELASELKQIELGKTGTFGDLYSAIKLASGRFNAIEHTTAILRGALQSLSLVAVFCTVILLTVPGQIREACALDALERLICVKVSALVDQQFTRDALLRFYKDAAVEAPLRELNYLTRNFPIEHQGVMKMQAATWKAQRASVKLAQAYRGLAEGGNFFGLASTMPQVEEQMILAVTAWAEASKEGSVIVKQAYSVAELTRAKAIVLNTVLTTATLLGLVCEGALLLIGAKSFYEIRRRRIEELTVKQIPD